MNSLFKNIYNGMHTPRLLVGVIGLFVMYSFFIVSTVVAINQRKDIRTDIRTVQARVADLEISYFTLASTVDVTKATSLGFVTAPVPEFAYTHVPEEKVALVR